MTTQNHTIGTTWTETVMDGDDFLLSLPSASRFDVDVATTDTVVAPTVGRGHVIAADLRKSITRALLGPGYVWTKAPKQYTATLSTWSSDLAAILALEGLVGYWPTDPAYLYSDDAGTTLATVGGSVAYRANLISGGPAAVQSTPANQPVLHKYSLSDFYWLETDDGSSTLTATTGDLGASCTVAYADANGAVFTEGVTISSTYSTTPAVGYNSDFMIFNRALTAAEKTLITRHLTRDRDFVQRELLAISGLTGYWKADPQYLFEDSAGTTPASTSGTGPVGQWRPLGIPMSFGEELVDTLNEATAWTTGGANTLAPDGDALKAVFVDHATAGIASLVSAGGLTTDLVIGNTYLITGQAKVSASGAVTINATNTSGVSVSQGAFTLTSSDYVGFEIVFTATQTNNQLRVTSFSSGESVWWRSLSIRQVITNAALQGTTANKPILRKTPTTGVYWLDSNTSTSALNVALSDTVLGRRNLLTYTEDFSNAAWSRTGFLSFGSGSIADALPSTVGPAALDLIIEDTNNVPHRAGQFPAVSTIIGTPINITVYVKQGPGSRYFGCQSLTAAGTYAHCVFDLSTKTYNANALIDSASITELPGGIFRLSIKCTPSAILPNSYVYFYSTPSATATVTTGTSPSYVGDGNSGFYIGGAQLEFGSVATDYQKITNVPAYCTLVRATAEGVTFTDNAEIAAPYNIAPAFSFNADVAIFNRALTATEKALITRYMARAVPMLGSNLVTNGTFDTDTVWTKGTGWSIGSGVASKSAGTASNLTQSVGVSGNTYYAKADAVVTAGTIGAYPGSGTTQFGSTSATGTLAYTMKASGTGIGVRGDASFAGNVDNATIKEIL